MTGEIVGVLGASARAAVASVLRAGGRAWAVDLFGDRDLRLRAPTAVCPFDDFPQRLPELSLAFPPGPFLYTGGLENHPEILASLQEYRPLLGNPPAVLAKVRDPFWLSRTASGLIVLPGEAPMPVGRWLRKSFHSAGGLGVCWAKPGSADGYLQEFVPGPALAAVFASDESGPTLLGISEQLVGEGWLHAGEFQYCGSVGPLAVETQDFQRLGQVLHTQAGLTGIWGVDVILGDDGPVPIEVNPRYTASVEVLELATRRSAFAAPQAFPTLTHIVGKAIYFAPHTLTFPDSGPWDDDLTDEFDPWRLPGYADIPAAGERIEAGRPVITVFAEAETRDDCRRRLQEKAQALDSLL